MYTKEWYDQQREKARSLLASAIAENRLDFDTICRVVDILGFQDGPTMWTADEVGSYLQGVSLPVLKGLLEEGSHFVRWHIREQGEEAIQGVDAAIREVTTAERDPKHLTVKDIHSETTHQWSKIVSLTIAFQSLLWAIHSPKPPDVYR
jgi:hypothetical protein